VIFNKTSVILFNRDGHYIQWSWDPQGVDPLTVELEILRSESPSGPFDILDVVDPVSTFSYFDYYSPRRPFGLTVYYKLRAVAKMSGAPLGESSPFSGKEAMSLDALWIIEQQRIVLEGVNGHRPIKGIPGGVTVYKLRNFGVRCKVCVDPVTGRINISNCQTCHGTGKLDGYYSPVNVGMNISQYDTSLVLTNTNKAEDSETAAYMNNYPLIYPGDLLVEPSEVHWRVSRVQVRERYRATVRQVLFINQINPDEIENHTLRHVSNGGKTI